MRRTLLFFLLLFFLQSAYSQNRTIGLVLKGNISRLSNTDVRIVPLPGFEIGTAIKFTWRKKIDIETGTTFRFFQYRVDLPNDVNVIRVDWKEQLLHFKIPFDLSFHLSPHRWRSHLGIWSSVLISANYNLGRSYDVDHRKLFSKLYFGTNIGVSHIFKSGLKLVLDYSYSINNIYSLRDGRKAFGKYRKGLDMISLGIITPIKFK